MQKKHLTKFDIHSGFKKKPPGIPCGLAVKGPGIVSAVAQVITLAQVSSLAWELTHAIDMAKKKKKKENSNERDIEETYLNTIKAIYEQPTTNVLINTESLSFKILYKASMPTLSFLFNIVMEVLTKALRHEKVKDSQITKER